MLNKIKNFKISTKKLLIAGSIILVFVSALCSWKLYKEASEIREVTKAYNILVTEYNELSKKYDEAIKKCCVDNIQGIPQELGTIKTESEDWKSAISVMLSSNSKEKIEKDIQTLGSLIEENKRWNGVIEQITEPSDEWVMERLDSTLTITEMQAVTETNDPDGLLDKEGGYKGCIYFVTNILEPSVVEGDNVVAKGTDAGGAVEIYSTVEEAEERCNYLAGFDGTILYSGSYAAVGTMVIRTSYMLSSEDQLNLTNEIVEAITRFE